MGFASQAQTLLAYHQTEVMLQVRDGAPYRSTQPGALSSPAVGITHAAFKITQETKKINTTMVRKEAVLLLHLTAPDNQVYVQASDAMGQRVMSVHYPAMEAGFYEIPMLPSSTQPQLYFVSLMVNHEAYSFQISPVS